MPKLEKPKQIPVIRTEPSGKIILATYPEKIKREPRGTSGEMFLELLVQGKIAEFNRMREQDQFVVPNLSRVNLKERNMQRVNLKDAKLEEANFEGANLQEANLGGTNLTLANLVGAYLGESTLERANLSFANLESANLGGANLQGANLQGAYLERANLRRTQNLPMSKKDAKSRGANV